MSKTTKPAAPAVDPLSSLGLLADELGQLEKDMAPYAQKIARIEYLRKSFRVACTLPADKEWTIEGSRFVVRLGVCGNQRVVDIPRLVKKITAAVYAKFATVTLKDLELNVAPAVVAAVVSDSATGPRTLKTFEKGAAASTC